MAQTHPENRRLLGQIFKKFQTQPGIGRVARPRRDADLVELARDGQIQDVGIVVLFHHRVVPKLLEGLDHVEGERVEVINK